MAYEELESDIIEVISRHYPYDREVIRSLYGKLRSYDSTIQTLNMAISGRRDPLVLAQEVRESVTA